MHTKYLHINTIGCQMNVYDSELIEQALTPLNYKITSSMETADLIIVNTCSIREKAEQKAFSYLGRLAGLKRKKPDLIVGIGGCVAQQEGEKILERMPHIDLIFGTHAITRLPGIIKQIESKRDRIVDVEMSGKIDEFESSSVSKENGKVTSFVTIMRGCDNYCSYCVVPNVRGRETSRHPDSIMKEIRGLVDSGIREITLLGQNVNSYGKKEGLCSFSELLSSINEISKLSRIRFTTSHPKDLSEDLMFAFKYLEKLCKHIHLPVQSGSNSILKRMNRKYAIESYLEKIDRLRRIYPDIAITSDFIVGFPGEADADFKKTLDLIKLVEYDGIYAFKYSDRPNTSAAGFLEKVSEHKKKDRLQKLLDLQEHYTTNKNQSLIGSTQLIFVEGLSKRQASRNGQPAFSIRDKRPQAVQWMGRTSNNKVVNFIQDDSSILCGTNLTGKMVNIRINKAFSHSLCGKLIKDRPTFLVLKGEEGYAA